MGELAEILRSLAKDLDELIKKSVEKGLHEDKEYFSQIRGLYRYFGSILMDLRAKGLIEKEVAEELLQLKEK
jgi:hypothetical protein